MIKIASLTMMLLMPVFAFADTDAEDLLASVIIINGFGCPDVTEVTQMGNDTYIVTCRATSRYPGAYNNGTYLVNLGGTTVNVTKIR